MTHRCQEHHQLIERIARCEHKAIATERDVTAAAKHVEEVAKDFLAGQNGLVKEMHSLMERFAELLAATKGRVNG